MAYYNSECRGILSPGSLKQCALQLDCIVITCTLFPRLLEAPYGANATGSSHELQKSRGQEHRIPTTIHLDSFAPCATSLLLTSGAGQY